MTNRITVPLTIEAAGTELRGIDAVLNTRGWARAAIVYAFCEPQQGRRNLVGNPTKLSVRDFAALKFPGLSHHETVERYRATWQDAVDRGVTVPAVPGEKVVLPDETYPPANLNHGIADDVSPSAPPERRAKAARRLLEDREVAELVMGDQLTANQVLGTRAARIQIIEREQGRLGLVPRYVEAPNVSAERDYDDDIERGVGLISQAINGLAEGKREPSALSRALLHFLVSRIQASTLAEGDPVVFAEQVEDFLRAQAG